ncbi:DUF2920 family protein [Campylobacter lari]|uniref:DUF2920 family protein n=1 Tax=Campylobacter lari TaxID=201 RepID=UPI00127ED021|nr:DUF2920 family protein [Campylobacter lari]EAI7247821.1 DUF2920 family protein [Campylobacter lari]EAK0798167.1 DUF2920 family protein [Campylobacter lari]EAW0605904.1 DUF2920 family protein [Campylobacter lari]MCW0183959.1 DUF2920 family protein [Campylobacter lari]
MLKNETYFIDSCDDVELNIKRESKLEFKLTYDDSKEIEAIICIIQGLGDDISEPMLNFNMKYFAIHYNVAVLSVNYHCIGNRPQTGAKYFFDDIDKLILNTSLKAINIIPPFDIRHIDTFEKINHCLEYIDNQISILKLKWMLDISYSLKLSITLQPTKNEYQNFGIMQAIDILNALLYIRKNPPFKIISSNIKHILVGASRGGYLANLCAKLAPWLVDVVIDNSSNALLGNLWRIIGFGKEVDYTKYYGFLTPSVAHNIILYGFEKTFWTSNSSSPNYFSNARIMIRDILVKDHLKTQSLYPKPKYIFYHSKLDVDLAPPEDKEELVKILRKFNFDIKLHMIKDIKDIDGKFIKNLNHGMGIPMKSLIEKHLPQILQEPLKDKTCKKEISYKCDDLVYTFEEINDQIILNIEKSS